MSFSNEGGRGGRDCRLTKIKASSPRIGECSPTEDSAMELNSVLALIIAASLVVIIALILLRDDLRAIRSIDDQFGRGDQ